jgi:hypothetical protein
VTEEANAMRDRFFRNPETGRLVIVQWPNLPLAIFFLSTLVRSVFHPDGWAGAANSVVGGVGLAWWSVDEILRGESPFRRVLGAIVLCGFALNLLSR